MYLIGHLHSLFLDLPQLSFLIYQLFGVVVTKMLNLIHHTVVRAGRNVTGKLLAVANLLAAATARVLPSVEDVHAGLALDLLCSLCQSIDREVGS